MPELTEAAIRNILTFAVAVGGVIAAFKSFYGAKSAPAAGPSATNELLAGMIRGIDQKLEIGVRDQQRNYDSIDRRLDEIKRELIEINTRMGG